MSFNYTPPSAAGTGGLEYKGTFNASTGLPDLSNAEQGDLYIISVAGTIYGQTWAVGDHLLINEDMGGTITNSKIDKVDNTDAVTSVNGSVGAVVLGGDDITADHTASNYTPTNANIDGHLAGIDSQLGAAAPVDSVNGQTGIVVLSGDDIAADHTAVYYTPTNANIDGHLAGIDTALNTTAPVDSVNGQTGVVNIYADDSTLNLAGSGLTISGTGASSTLNADVTSVNGSTGAVVLSGDDIAADHTAVNYTATNANIDGHLAGIDAALSTAGAVDSVNGQTGVVNIYADDSTLNIAGSGLTISGTGATSTLNADVTSVNGATGAVSLGLDDLNDVNLGTPVDADVLKYNATTGEWISSATPGNFLTAIVQDLTPQLGGPLDTNGQSITSASNANVTIDPDGTGDISIGADIIPDTDFTYTIGDEDFRFHSFGTLNGAVRFKAKNDSGGTMTRGQVVYIKGISGTVPTVDLARANAAATMPAFGLVWSATANDQAEVQIVTFGQLEDANTSTLTPVNSTLYVSAATAGALTVTAPTGESNFIQNIGRVLRVDGSAGVIRVGGAGRSNATPNLNTDNIFIGNGSNQAVTKAISTIELDEFSNTTSGFIKNVVEDLTPQLGGNIDVNSQEIVSVSNGDIVIAPNGTGSLVVKDEKSLKFNESTNTYSVAVKAPNTLAASYSLTLPVDDGTTSQLLSTDGNGVLSWADALLVSQNLADLNDIPTSRSNLGLGTAALKDAGTLNGNVLLLSADNSLPTLNGSNLTNLNIPTLNDIGNVDTTGKLINHLLTWKGTNWEPDTLQDAMTVTYQPDPHHALMKVSSSYTFTAGTGIVSFDSIEYDTDSLADTTNNRFTIPATGITKVKCKAGVFCSDSDTGQVVLRIIQYNSGNTRKNYFSSIIDVESAGSEGNGAFTPIVEVDAGDYFVLELFATNTRTISSDYTWFEIEVVDGSILTTLVNTTTSLLVRPVNAQTGSFTAVENKYYRLSPTGSITITLPTATAAGDGGEIDFKLATAQTVTINVASASGDLIDGSSSITMNTQWAAIRLKSNGSSVWDVLTL